MNTVVPKKPEQITFYIFMQNGQRDPNIKKAFIRDLIVDVQDLATGFISLPEDNTKWKLVLDPVVREQFKHFQQVSCIVSCQVRESGDYAVCRLAAAKARPRWGKEASTEKQA